MFKHYGKGCGKYGIDKGIGVRMAVNCDEISELHRFSYIKAVVSKSKKKDGKQVISDLYVRSAVIFGNDDSSVLFGH